MKWHSPLRLANYTLVAAIVALLPRQVLLLPAHALSEDLAEILFSEPARLKESGIIINTVGFTDTKLSGAQVAAIVKAELRKNRIDTEGFYSPEIRLVPRNTASFGPFAMRPKWAPGTIW